MAFELKDRDLLGRIGRLTTKSGVVETPAFMPVINPITQVISPKKMYNDFKCRIVITNSYLIRRNFSEVPNLDVHKLLDYPGVVMTDSGAYQILVYGGVDVDPAEIVEYQESIGSDIGVILDIPTGWDVPRDRVEYTVNETLRRAEAAVPLIRGSKALWVGPVQGGRHLDLVAKSAQEVGKLPFQIHALGSPTEVMERYMFSVLVDMIMTAKRNLPPDRPLHLFGAGHPMMFSLAVALGCDLFDSASYALYGKEDRYLTPHGTLRLGDMGYLPCSCPICRSHDIEALRNSTKGERVRLISEHNLYVCMSEIDVVKQAIVEGSLWDLVERRSRGHPSMTTALNKLKEYKDDLEQESPSFKGHGVFYYDYHSLTRPEVTRHKKRLSENYKKPDTAEVLILISSPKNRPFTSDENYKKLKEYLITELGNRIERLHIAFYSAPYGVIPEPLSETYPLSQYEIAEPIDMETMLHTAEAVRDYVKLSMHKKVVLYRGRGALDDEVESACINAADEVKIELITLWNSEIWSVDAFKTLSQTLKDHV